MSAYQQMPQQQQQQGYPPQQGQQQYAQQPMQQQQPQQVVVVQQGPPQPQFVPVSDWQTGLCDCFSDFPSCLEGYFCWYCQNSRQKSMLERGVEEMGCACCFGIMVGDCCCGYLPTIWITCSNRGALRGKYNIPGGSCGDCCVSMFCHGCVTCQNYREMTARGHWPGGVCVGDKPQNCQVAAMSAPMGAVQIQQGQPMMVQQGQQQQQQQPQYDNQKL
jgi:Cys-rich protein (TIGR01571 family)